MSHPPWRPWSLMGYHPIRRYWIHMLCFMQHSCQVCIKSLVLNLVRVVYLMNRDSLIPELNYSFPFFSSCSSRPNPRCFLWTPLRLLARHHHIIYRHRHWTRWQGMLEFAGVDLWALQFSSGFIHTHIWCYSSPSQRWSYGAQSGIVAEDLAK